MDNQSNLTMFSGSRQPACNHVVQFINASIEIFAFAVQSFVEISEKAIKIQTMSGSIVAG